MSHFKKRKTISIKARGEKKSYQEKRLIPDLSTTITTIRNKLKHLSALKEKDYNTIVQHPVITILE